MSTGDWYGKRDFLSSCVAFGSSPLEISVLVCWCPNRHVLPFAHEAKLAKSRDLAVETAGDAALEEWAQQTADFGSSIWVRLVDLQ